MAPNTRTRRRKRDVVSTLSPPVETAAGSAPPLADSDNPINDHWSCNPGHGPSRAIRLAEEPQTHDPEARDPDRRTSWTPEPEPYDPDTYTAWGRKHFGEDWYEQRKTMLQERNIYYNDPLYNKRQRALRKMERERQAGKLPLKGKTWQELIAWARMHYGEAWYQHREAIARLDKKISAPEEDKVWSKEEEKLISKLDKHRDIMETIQLDTDERMLAEGKTWHDILAFPAEPSNITPSIEVNSYRSPSPSSDGDTDLSGYNTYPPTPTDLRDEAKRGPDGPRDEWDHSWRWNGPEDQWDWKWDDLEWRGVHRPVRVYDPERRNVWSVSLEIDLTPEEAYKYSRNSLRGTIRSHREDDEGDRRREKELEEIRNLRWSRPEDRDSALEQLAEYERRMSHFNLRREGLTQEQIDAKERDPKEYERQKRLSDLRGKGWTQEQIDAADRADDALRDWRSSHPAPRGSSFLGRAVTQEERDAHDAWLQKETAAKLRIYGELPPRGSGGFGTYATERERDAYDVWRRNIHSRVAVQQRHEPRPDAAATDASATGETSQPRSSPPRRTKDVSRKIRREMVSRERQNELAPYGFHEWPASTDGHAESKVASQWRAPPPRPAKDASRKTHQGRITKNAPQRQRGTRSRQSAPTSTEAQLPDRRCGSSKPDELGELGDVTTATQRRRQRKTYEKERTSRRIAGQLPEFGMLPGRGETPAPYEASLRQPSNARKTGNSGPRGGRLSKKPTAVRGAKPQGISKSKQTGRS